MFKIKEDLVKKITQFINNSKAQLVFDAPRSRCGSCIGSCGGSCAGGCAGSCRGDCSGTCHRYSR